MQSIHVILSLSSALVRDAIRQELKKSDAVRVVAEVLSPMDLLYSAGIQEADAVILDANDATDQPGVLSHLFAEFPRLMAVVVGRQDNRAVIYQQKLCKKVYEGASLTQLLTEIHKADSDYWAWRNNGGT